MKQVLICALVAAAVSVLVLSLEDALEGTDEELSAAAGTASGEAGAGSGDRGIGARPAPALRYTDALPEDTWVNAARQAGSDRRTLTSASDSVCFITKIELSGIQGPEDTSSCAVEVDDFTGFWQLVATADEGGRSEIRCNARCLSWSPEEEPQ